VPGNLLSIVLALCRPFRSSSGKFLRLSESRWDTTSGHHLCNWNLPATQIPGYISPELLLLTEFDAPTGKLYYVSFVMSCITDISFQLDPYFSRIHFTKEQKLQWFKDREGVLFGFGVGFFIFLKIPLVGVLIYGIAEASTAYLITKI